MAIASDYDNSFDRLDPESKMEVDFIITGNPYTEFTRLYDDGVKIPIFFNPDKQELMDIVLHKSNIINKVNVTKFYEDQEIQIALLKTLCPKCKFIKV